MSSLSQQVTPAQTTDQTTDTPQSTQAAPGTREWALQLAQAAGNSHLLTLLGALTGGGVGAALLGLVGSTATAALQNGGQTTGGQPPETQTPETQPPQLTVRVTASRLNVRSSPDSAGSGNLLGQLTQGTQIAVVGQQGDWLMIEYNGQSAFIKAEHTSPVQQTGTGGANTTDTAGATPPNPEAPETAEGVSGVGTQATTDRTLALANDFNAVPVWTKGVAGDQPAATTFRTPYVLNVVSEADEAGTIKNLTIAEGRPHAGEKVRSAASNNPFIGKATPEQMQIVAQACVDNDLATPATIQSYVNQGRMRESGSRNGKFGVDCSGFTSQLMNELEGEGREGFESTNAASYKHDGSRDYTPVSPDDAASGDVISYEYTNHVVVVYQTQDVQIPMVGGQEGGPTKRAVKLSVAESTGSQNSSNSQYIRTDRGFWYFPGATEVMGRANTAGPEWILASAAGASLPKYTAALGQASYSGGSDWTTGYTLNCATDRNGTNVRVRSADGRFSSTPTVIPNGAANVELREVSGDMVRVRYNGNDTQNGQEMWVPVRYVATQGSSWSVPQTGQPSGMSANRYSVVRNPNIPGPQAEQQTAT